MTTFLRFALIGAAGAVLLLPLLSSKRHHHRHRHGGHVARSGGKGRK